jgi:3-hydroxyacyl-[acyl-carrier-protein] dehydratase
MLEHLPHAEPFRFLTRLGDVTPGVEGSGAWAVTGSEDFFRGHFPGDPIVPGVLIGEALAQLSGIVGLSPGKAGRLVHVDVRFDRSVRPPAEMVLRSRRVRSMGALHQFEVSAECCGERVARGSLVLAEGGAA